MRLTSAQEKEIRDLVAAGQRIVAVKLCRQITGLGLNEALQMVDQVAGGGSGAAPRGAAGTATPAPRRLDATALKNAQEAAMAAVRGGRIIEAVKIFRERTGLGLKESKDEVDILNLVHQSGGRVSVTAAKTVMAELLAGRRDQALTQLMAGSGYEEAEARAFLATVKRLGIGRRGCGAGCAGVVVLLLVLLGLAVAAWVALQP